MGQAVFRAGTRLGKYKLVERLGRGGFATVYRARDAVEGRDVALKLPDTAAIGAPLADIVREVRIVIKLDHPNILRIDNADIVDGQLIIASPLGHESLASRLTRRIASSRALHIFEQVLEAAAHAHAHRVIHCDINPANVILFDDDRVCLADFGLARVVARSGVLASGSGTVGYIAPEQAMGHPSFRSDVFSLGLVGYLLFSGQLPRWPYRAPLPGGARIRRKLTPAMVSLLVRAFHPNERKRFKDAGVMLRAYDALGEVLR